jgi:hypothetical protein
MSRPVVTVTGRERGQVAVTVPGGPRVASVVRPAAPGVTVGLPGATPGPAGPEGPEGPPGPPGSLQGIQGSVPAFGVPPMPATGTFTGEAWIVGPAGELWVWK